LHEQMRLVSGHRSLLHEGDTKNQIAKSCHPTLSSKKRFLGRQVAFCVLRFVLDIGCSRRVIEL
jgi:hypothetical protein